MIFNIVLSATIGALFGVVLVCALAFFGGMLLELPSTKQRNNFAMVILVISLFNAIAVSLVIFRILPQ